MENSKTLFDPTAWLDVENESNQVKVETTNTIKARPSTENVDELAKAEAVCKEMIAQGANIAESYEDYLKLGFALAQGLGNDGRDIYHQLCSQSTKYNRDECEKQWQDCLTKGNGSVTIASFYKMAQDAGVDQRTVDVNDVVEEQPEEEAEVVRQIFRMYADGFGYSRISTHLNQYCKPKRGKQWGRSTINNMLTNPVYIGKIKWGKRKTIKSVESGEIIKRYHERKDYPCYQGKHEPIITEELWNEVQSRKNSNETIPRVKTSNRLINPLAGLIVCDCGYSMNLWTHANCTARLVCPNNMTCGSASCTYREMEDIVENILRQSISDFEVKISAGEDDRIAEKAEFKKQLKRRLTALDEKETGIWEKYAEGMPKRIFETLIAELTDERSRIETMIAEAEKEKPVHYSELITTFHAALECLGSDETAEKKNALLKKCIRRIVYHRKKIADKNVVNPITVDVELNI